MMMGLMAIQVLSSTSGLMRLALSMIVDAEWSASAYADDENDSFLSLCAYSQSLIAVRLDMTSAHPDAKVLNGAFDMIDVSASTAFGVAAFMDLGPMSAFKDALSDAIPSWAADVGMLTKGMWSSLATILPISILLPPPTARMNFAPKSLPSLMALSTLDTVALPVRCVAMWYPASVRWSSTTFPAGLKVFSPEMIRPLDRKLRSSQTDTISSRMPCPMMIFLGNSISLILSKSI